MPHNAVEQQELLRTAVAALLATREHLDVLAEEMPEILGELDAVTMRLADLQNPVSTL